MRLCEIGGCGRKYYARGVCELHYKRWNEYGRLELAQPRGPLEDRFFAKIDKTSSKCGCWLWAGARTGKGYGAIQEAGKGSKMVLAHRLSYTIHKGPIEKGLLILHSCDTPQCVNPDHLRAGSQSENILESFAKGRKLLPHEIKRRKVTPPRSS